MTLVQRMIGAAKLDVATYEAVEADQSATGQAMTVVVLSAVAAGIGSMGGGNPVLGLILGLVAALVGWIVWAFLCYIIGTKILPEPQTNADLGQLLRTVGFAQSPGILRVLGIIPFLGILINLLLMVWMICTTVVAVRQALDYQSTGRAVGVVLIGFVIYMMILMLMTAIGLGGALIAGGLAG